jgi:predicted nucleic acid-binding protein
LTLYVDTSALLRIVLGEPGALDDIRSADQLVSSELLAVEARRTIDRLHRQGVLSSDEMARRSALVADWLEAIDLVLLRPVILNRAGDPLPIPVGTLDAVHLATALVWRERSQRPVTIATHDTTLGVVAQAYALPVIGC